MAKGKGIAHRAWNIRRDEYADDQSFREAVQAELAMCENIGERLGVAIVASPAREKVGNTWYTQGWRFTTASTPAVGNDEVDALEQALEAEPALVDDLAPAEA